MMNGKIALETFSIVVSAMGAEAKSTEPTGGVPNPIIRFTIIIVAKCISLIPNASAMGSIIGPRIRIFAVASPSQGRKD